MVTVALSFLAVALASPIHLPRDICGLGHVTCPDRLNPGLTVCINPFWSNDYCGSGACLQCAPNQSCIGGICGTCPTGNTLCYDYITSYCADLNTSVGDCGACGVRCESGNCKAGKCVSCGGGQMGCGGRCVNTANDNANCGGCSIFCAPGANCVGGKCVGNGCGPGQAVCGSGCANLANDNQNCGACGVKCAVRKNCVGGVCR